MNTRFLVAILATLIVLLLFAASAFAMSSANYRLDWYVQLSGGGGGPASSTSYATNFTVGQTAAGQPSSTSYRAGLGYWYGADVRYTIYLPLVFKNA